MIGSPLKSSALLLLVLLIGGAVVWWVRPAPVGVPEPARSLVLDTVLARVQAQSGRRDWTLYSGDYANRRWSELAAIDRATVKHLTRRFSIPTGAGKKGASQTTPLVADGMMYLTSPVGHVVAWDLRRGRAAWRFHHSPTGELLCCGPSNRGVALGHGHVYLGTLDAKLIALDAATGAPVWTAAVDSAALGYSVTMAPLVVDSLVIVGTSGAEFGVRGHVSAFRARDGTLAWRRYTIPSPEEGGWWGRLVRHHIVGRAAASRPRPGARRLRALCRQLAPWRRVGVDRAGVRPAIGAALCRGRQPCPVIRPERTPGRQPVHRKPARPPRRDRRDRLGPPVHSPRFLGHGSGESADPGPHQDGLAVAEAGKIGHLFVLDAGSGRLLARSAPLVPQANLFAPRERAEDRDRAGPERRGLVVSRRLVSDHGVGLRRRAAPADVVPARAPAVATWAPLVRRDHGPGPAPRGVRDHLRRGAGERAHRLAGAHPVAPGRRRARDGGRSDLHRRKRRLVPRLRRRDRRAALAVPLRGGSQRAADRLRGGRRADDRRRRRGNTQQGSRLGDRIDVFALDRTESRP